MAEVRLEATSGGSLEKLEAELRDVEAELERLKGVVSSVSGKPLDLPTDPAEADIKRLVKELRQLESAFDRAEKALSFARTRNEIEQTAAAARRLAQAEATLAARGRELIEFSRRLPPELARGAAAMDGLEKQTEQAAAAFREFERARPKSAGIGSLVSAIGSLRAGIGSLIAALGVQQLIRWGRALIEIGANAVETKKKFDALIPALREFVGSTELAEEVADKLAATADRLKTPLAGLINPFLGISSGGKEAGLSIREINELFEASLVSARTFGKGADEVQRLLTGISQVAGKGVASMEEFRQQIGEAIPNAIPALAKGLGVTVPEAIKLISSGTFDAAEALRALTRGFEELNRAAGLAQLDTLAGDIGAFERATEEARRALADGLEPGLRSLIQTVTELLEQNPDLIRQLGEIGSAGLEGLSGLLEKLIEVRQGYKVVGEEALQLASTLDFLSASGVAGAGPIANAYRSVGNVLADVRSQAEAAFEAIEAGARVVALGSAKSAEDILEEFSETFQGTAEAAGIAAVDIERTQKTLADRVGAIAEESAKARALLEKQVADDFEQFGTVREETADRVARTLLTIEEQSARARAALLDELIEETKRAAEERIKAEAEAAAEIAAFLDGVVEKAREAGEKRAAADAEVSDKIEQIERELQEKLEKLRDEAAEKLKKPKADRVKIAEELTEKIVEVERDAAEKIRAEIERVAEADEKAAERRLKALEKIQKELEKSVETYQDIVAALKEAAEGSEEGGGGGFQKIGEQIQEARELLSAFIIDLEQLNAGTSIGDAGAFLESTFAGLNATLGASGGSFDSWFTGVEEAADGAQEAGGKIRDEFISALREAADAAEGLSGPVRDTVASIIADYANLAESGQVTREDFRAFADELSTAFTNAGLAVGDPIAEIRQQLESLGESQEQAAEKAEEAGKKQEEAAGTAIPVWDEATHTLKTVEEGLEGVAGAAEEGAQRIERAADGTITITDALEKTGEAGEKAKEGLDQVAEGAQAAGPPLQAVADAAAALPEELVGADEAQKLTDVGAAAAEALPSIEPLAEPLTSIAESSTSLSESLPVLAEQLPLIAAPAEKLLTLLAESPIDFEALAAQVAALAEPLAAIQTAITPISEAVAALPDPLAALQTAAEPLFALAQAAGEDERFLKIGAGLQSMADALPGIPEPLQAAQAALEALAGQRDEIQGVLDDIAKGLKAVAAEEVLKGLVELSVTLGDLIEPLRESADHTERWKTAMDSIVKAVPEVNIAVGALADNLNDRVIPALKNASEDTDGLRVQMVDLSAAMDETARAAENLGKVGTEALDSVRAKAVEAAAALRDVAAAAAEAAAALANVSVP